MSVPNLSVEKLEGTGDLKCYEGHEGFIDCTELQNSLEAHYDPDQSQGDDYEFDVTPAVAAHINDELYAEIFGAAPPTAAALDAWVAQEAAKLVAMEHTDPQVDRTYVDHKAIRKTLGDGQVGRNDMDYFVHILSQRVFQDHGEHQLKLGEGDLDDKYDHVRTDLFAQYWDPKFGQQRDMSKIQTLVTSQNPVVYSDEDAIGETRPLCGARWTPDADTPSFSYVGGSTVEYRDLRHLHLSEGERTHTTPLRYTVDGQEFKIYRLDKDNTMYGKPLPVPVAQLPDGRMVASIPGYAVLDYDRDGEVESDRFADVVEITWDPDAMGRTDNLHRVRVQTFLGGETTNAKALSGTERADVDGDGHQDRIQRETQNKVFANRSLADEHGQSRNPDGWQGYTAKSTTRVTITHGDIGPAIHLPETE